LVSKVSKNVPAGSVGNPAEIRPLRDDPRRCRGKIVAALSMIPAKHAADLIRGGYRFCGKIMPKQKDKARLRFNEEQGPKRVPWKCLTECPSASITAAMNGLFVICGICRKIIR